MLLDDISEYMRSTRLNILDNLLTLLKCSFVQFFFHQHLYNDTIGIIFNYNSTEGIDETD